MRKPKITMNLLSRFTVWCTRPAAQNAAWIEQLQADGFNTLDLPALAIRSLSLEQTRLVVPPGLDQKEQIKLSVHSPRELRDKLYNYEHIVYVSRNAIMSLAKLLADLPAMDRAKKRRCVRHWPIGQSTSELFHAELADRLPGTLMPSPAGMNSKTLYASMQKQLEPEEQVLMVRGKGGLPYLAESLNKAGVSVDMLECYERISPPELEESAGNLHIDPSKTIITAFSGETLINLTTAIDQFGDCSSKAVLRDLVVIVPQDRVVHLAESLGYTSVIRAKNAGAEAMRAALLHAAASV